MTNYTIEVYKADKRCNKGEKLVNTVEHTADLATIKKIASLDYPESKGFRIEIHETYVTRINMMSGKEYQEHYRTPNCCSPASETYWSM